MQLIPLAQLPNQTFSIQADNNFYDFEIKLAGTEMLFSVSVNNVLTISNNRIIINTPLIPYQYLENGNFFLSSINAILPDYNLFGVNQNLYYLSQEELATIRSGG